MLRRVAEVLGVTDQVKIQRKTDANRSAAAEDGENIVNKNTVMTKELSFGICNY